MVKNTANLPNVQPNCRMHLDVHQTRNALCMKKKTTKSKVCYENVQLLKQNIGELDVRKYNEMQLLNNYSLQWAVN